MRFKRCGDKIVVRIDKDEEIVEIVKRVCSDNNVRLGSVNGIGSTNQATIGLSRHGGARASSLLPPSALKS